MMRSAASLLITLALLTGCMAPAPAPTEDVAPGSSPTRAPVDTSPPASDPPGTPTQPSLEPLPSSAAPSPDLTARPLIWFVPHPETRLPDFMKGSADFFDLFAPDSPWSTAAAHTQVFKVYDNLAVAREATDDEIRTVTAAVRDRGMALAMELGPLPNPLAGGRNTECGLGIEGFAGEFTIQTLQRMKSLGARVDFVAFDEPFAHGSLYEGPNACQWSIERVASEIVEYVRQAREVYPDLVVGDIEPAWNGPLVGAAEVGAWLDGYGAAAGEPLGFFHLDVDWTRPGWQTIAREIEEAVRARGVPFGIIYNGGEDAASDAEWLQLAADRAYDFEQLNGGDPDHVVFQSWHFYPTRVLPDNDPATFTGLLNRYFGQRTSLEVTQPGSSSNPSVTGRLSTVNGTAVAGATIAGMAQPLDGTFQELRVDGTVPDGAHEALVAFRINSEGAGPGPADMRIYEISLSVGGGDNVLANPRFNQQLAGWFALGEGRATTPASDRDGGRMLRLRVEPGQTLHIDTSNFGVTAGAPYELTVAASIPAESADAGYISVIFLAADGLESQRDILPLAPTPMHLPASSTNVAGDFTLSAGDLEPGRYLLQIRFDGDLDYWPSWVEQAIEVGP